MTDIHQVIDDFFTHYQKSFSRLVTPFDPQWASPCEKGSHWLTEEDQACIEWQPVRRDAKDDFAGLEQALELPIHPDIKVHYGRYWSAHLEAEAPDGHVSLLYLWNEEDAARLVENLIGHAVACRHNRTPFSVFFACTDPDSDLYLTVNNDSGVVQLEEPGKKPLRTVAPCLADFYRLLVPAERH